MLAGEQSSGTFVRVANESDALNARSRATVDAVEELEPLAAPSLPNALLARQGGGGDGRGGPFRRARVTVSFPIANVGRNLPTLAATLAGNLYDLGETTGLRLEHVELPAAFRARFAFPRHGVKGTRALAQVTGRPLIGTIIKPNVGPDRR